MKHIKWQWIAKGILFGTLFVAVFTGLTMYLWNTLAVPIFGLPVISFFQALGLMILGRLLTGGFGPRGWGGAPGRGRYMRERWKNMSAEERAQFMQRWGRHGCGPVADKDDLATDQQSTTQL